MTLVRSAPPETVRSPDNRYAWVGPAPDPLASSLTTIYTTVRFWRAKWLCHRPVDGSPICIKQDRINAWGV